MSTLLRLRRPIRPPIPETVYIDDELSSSDIVCSGSDDDDDDDSDAAARTARIRAKAEGYLRDGAVAVYIHSATLRGPVEVNPWRKRGPRKGSAAGKRGRGGEKVEETVERSSSTEKKRRKKKKLVRGTRFLTDDDDEHKDNDDDFTMGSIVRPPPPVPQQPPTPSPLPPPPHRSPSPPHPSPAAVLKIPAHQYHPISESSPPVGVEVSVRWVGRKEVPPLPPPEQLQPAASSVVKRKRYCFSSPPTPSRQREEAVAAKPEVDWKKKRPKIDFSATTPVAVKVRTKKKRRSAQALEMVEVKRNRREKSEKAGEEKRSGGGGSEEKRSGGVEGEKQSGGEVGKKKNGENEKEKQGREEEQGRQNHKEEEVDKPNQEREKEMGIGEEKKTETKTADDNHPPPPSASRPNTPITPTLGERMNDADNTTADPELQPHPPPPPPPLPLRESTAERDAEGIRSQAINSYINQMSASKSRPQEPSSPPPQPPPPAPETPWAGTQAQLLAAQNGFFNAMADSPIKFDSFTTPEANKTVAAETPDTSWGILLPGKNTTTPNIQPFTTPNIQPFITPSIHPFTTPSIIKPFTTPGNIHTSSTSSSSSSTACPPNNNLAGGFTLGPTELTPFKSFETPHVSPVNTRSTTLPPPPPPPLPPATKKLVAFASSPHNNDGKETDEEFTMSAPVTSSTQKDAPQPHQEQTRNPILNFLSSALPVLPITQENPTPARSSPQLSLNCEQDKTLSSSMLEPSLGKDGPPAALGQQGHDQMQQEEEESAVVEGRGEDDAEVGVREMMSVFGGGGWDIDEELRRLAGTSTPPSSTVRRGRKGRW